MSITITVPATPLGLARALTALAEPCLLVAVAAVGGPMAAAVGSGVLRAARSADVRVSVKR